MEKEINCVAARLAVLSMLFVFVILLAEYRGDVVDCECNIEIESTPKRL
jgi:hypothetical protein